MDKVFYDRLQEKTALVSKVSDPEIFYYLIDYDRKGQAVRIGYTENSARGEIEKRWGRKIEKGRRD